MIWNPSPNFGERTLPITMLVLHYTGMPTGAAAIDWLANPASKVSAHYVVDEDGQLVHMVREEQRAQHAGLSYWRGITDCNSASIGIEIVNTGHAGGLPAYPEPQILSVIALCRDIAQRYNISPPRVLAHSDIAPDRKADPGEHFPWDRLAAAHVGHWVEPAPIGDGVTLDVGAGGEDVLALQRELARYGYDVAQSGFYDEATSRVVRAFQRHFRPRRVDGVADLSTRDTLQRLSAALSYSAAARA